jgi:hypothetical protein
LDGIILIHIEEKVMELGWLHPNMFSQERGGRERDMLRLERKGPLVGTRKGEGGVMS